MCEDTGEGKEGRKERAVGEGERERERERDVGFQLLWVVPGHLVLLLACLETCQRMMVWVTSHCLCVRTGEKGREGGKREGK